MQVKFKLNATILCIFGQDKGMLNIGIGLTIETGFSTGLHTGFIMKTRGTLADPPDGAQVVWCQYNGNRKCGYYEISGNNITGCSTLGKRDVSQDISRTSDNHDYSSKRARMSNPDQQNPKLQGSCSMEVEKSPAEACFKESMYSNQYTRRFSGIKKNLCFTYEDEAMISKEREIGEGLIEAKHASDVTPHVSQKKLPWKPEGDYFEYSDTWIQCDACHKWRKLVDKTIVWLVLVQRGFVV